MSSQGNITWNHKGWHYLVHRRLGEVLFYYLARIRPFNPKESISEIDQLITNHKLGSVRIFPIFGPYDLLIRAWLHPSIEAHFREQLEKTLEQSKALRPFAVTSIEHKWYLQNTDNKRVDRALLANLDGKMVRAVQNDEDQELLKELIRGHLVIEREQQTAANNIKFFTAINVEDDAQAARSDIVKGIERFIIERGLIQFPSIYRGFGFCSILVKGQLNKFFDVQELPNWIGSEYSAFGVSTETYLVHGPTHIAGNEDIGEATFKAIEGKNLFIQSIIPELYESDIEIKFEIEKFLRDVEHNESSSRDLSQHDKKLLHDYFYGLLTANYPVMAQTLFIYFYSLEGFLREAHKDFAEILLQSREAIGELYRQISPGKETGKFLSLGELLRIYKYVLEKGNVDEEVSLSDDWQDLVQIRNKIAHGDVDFQRNWSEIVATLIAKLPRIRKLITLVEKTTNTQYSPYFG